MKKLILMLCLAAISVAATAQYSVSGYVYYFGTNKPVPKTYVQALDKNADFKTAAGDAKGAAKAVKKDTNTKPVKTASSKVKVQGVRKSGVA